MQGYDFESINALLSSYHHFPDKGIIIATRVYKDFEKIEEQLFLFGIHQLELVMDPRIRSAWSSKDQRAMFKVSTIMDKGVDEYWESNPYQYRIIDKLLERKGYQCLLHLQQPNENKPQRI